MLNIKEKPDWVVSVCVNINAPYNLILPYNALCSPRIEQCNLESVAWNPGLSSTSLHRWPESYDLKKHNRSWTARFAFCLYFQYCMRQSLVSIISEGNLPTPQASQVSRCRKVDTLLQHYRGLQKAAKQPLKVEQTKCQLVCTSMWWCKHTEILHMAFVTHYCCAHTEWCFWTSGTLMWTALIILFYDSNGGLRHLPISFL